MMMMMMMIMMMIIIIIITIIIIIIIIHMTECVQLHFNIFKKTGIKLDNEHWCEQVRTKISRNKS
jgi:hypothetical protein